MAKQLVVSLCQTFQKEIESLTADAPWDNVQFHFLPEVCRFPHLKVKARQALDAFNDLPDHELMTIGCALDCLLGREADEKSCSHALDLCLDMIYPANLTARLVAEMCYLITPGWLDHWQDLFTRWGMDQNTARSMYRESTRKIVLLDTFTNEHSPAQLEALSAYLDLPVETIPVGTAYLRLYLDRLIQEWINRQTVSELVSTRNEANRISADYAMAMDLLTNLAQIRDEDKAIVEVLDLFTMLFSASSVLYFPVEDLQIRLRGDHTLAPEQQAELEEWLRNSDSLLEDSKTGNGFRLRLRHRDTALGILVVEGLSLPQYRARYINLAGSIANLCGLAINNARMYRQLQEAEAAALTAHRVSENLRHVLSELVSERDLKAILKKALTSLAEIAPFSGAAVYLLSGDMYQYQIGFTRAANQEMTAFLPPESLRQVSETSIPLLTGVSSVGGVLPQLFPVNEEDASEHLFLPLAVREQQNGFLVFTLPTRQGHSLDFLETFGNEVSIAVENARLFAEIEVLATKDGLTDLFNRRYFYDLAKVEFNRSRRYQSPLSGIMLDIDHFKQVNDTHGHPAGDLVLKTVAGICQQNIRGADLVGRYGGEEFVFLLPETGCADAFLLAERIRRLIAETECAIGNGETIRVTVSVGVAEMRPMYANIEELLACCDEALYRAKQTGRNRTVMYEPHWQGGEA